MKAWKVLAASLLACAALVFTSCDKGVTNTGDFTGNIYGIWMLDSKTVDRETVKTTDFTSEHFYLCLNQIRMAFGKTGSLAGFDLDHVDVDFSWYAYNDQKHQISFDDPIILRQGLKEVMNVYGTYDVLNLSKDNLVISKTTGSSTTTYSFHKMFQQEEQGN
ncbi:MAG: hypothetical protein IJ156_08370 [Bacteroidales bacterium]|nr:hypothetical protein [Bacteroidales bacterium]